MNRIIKYLISDKVSCNMKKLYPKWEVSDRLISYYSCKLKYVTYVVVAGCTIFLLILYTKSSEVSETGQIKRNDYGKGNKIIHMDVSDDCGYVSNNVDVTVSEKRYTSNQLDEMIEDCVAQLRSKILSENDSLDHVCNNLKFINKLDEYPFSITYRTDKPLILSNKGYIDEDKLEKELTENNTDSVEIQITAEIKYYDYEVEDIFYVSVYRKELSEEETFIKHLESTLLEEDKLGIHDEFYMLPVSVDGRNISFREHEKNNEYVVLMITVVSAILIYYMKDRELNDEVTKREEELKICYPSFVNRFVLFYNAGMPVGQIWMKFCGDYLADKKMSTEKKYLYEEMIIARKQILDGKREIDAYEEFASRIGLQKYRVFVNLILQAVAVGDNEICLKLRTECDNAYLERKNNAKRKCEEAGTKLLVPMFMMLAVIMVIIMFPAVYSFKI